MGNQLRKTQGGPSIQDEQGEDHHLQIHDATVAHRRGEAPVRVAGAFRGRREDRRTDVESEYKETEARRGEGTSEGHGKRERKKILVSSQ